ncbi:hypothetical protein GW17_00050049 [Ensete ventricosum]|nr:hypothetical protein GW17_00050049 [Ensete ventricosum]
MICLRDDRLRLTWQAYGAMDLDVLRKKLKASGGKSSSPTRVTSSPPEVDEIRVDAMPKRPVGTVKKHKSPHGEGSSQAVARGKEPTALTEGDASPTYCRVKTMKDLCGTRVCKDNEGYYALQITNSAPKDLDASV